MVPTVIGLPAVTNPKQKKATGMSSAYWNLLLKPTFLAGKENSGGRLSTQRQQSLTTIPGFAACIVSCPPLAADPQEPRHPDCDLMAQKPSPINQQLSEAADCGQLTKRHLAMAFLPELGYRQGPVQTHEPVKHGHCPKTLTFKPGYSKVVWQSARELIRWLDECTLSVSFESFPFFFICFLRSVLTEKMFQGRNTWSVFLSLKL